MSQQGRIGKTFSGLEAETALVGFITAGDPTIEHTVPALHALVEGGVDVLELGVPFSDPEAEGPAIQRSSERALANGVTLDGVFGMVRAFRERDERTPVILMGYLNSFLARADFAQAAAEAGVDGVIIVNLPPEESGSLGETLASHGIDTIFLVAPTTADQRVQTILTRARGFVYYVSLKGITGADHLNVDEVRAAVGGLKAHTELPVCVGFGIKDAATARAIGSIADGVVVGSALVNLMADHADDVDACASALTQFAAELKAGLKHH